jgi:hypothetical protein
MAVKDRYDQAQALRINNSDTASRVCQASLHRFWTLVRERKAYTSDRSKDGKLRVEMSLTEHLSKFDCDLAQ